MDPEHIKKDVGGWFSSLSYNQWIQLQIASQSPTGRYKHAAVVVGTKLYVSGGSRNGRHLSDFQVLDLIDLTWSSIDLTADASASKLEDGSMQKLFPATSGHNMVVWRRKLLFFGRPSKTVVDYSTVLYVDIDKSQCGTMEAFGKIPVAREGHSVTLFGSKLILFGGEDVKRRLLNDTYILDLNNMTWDEVESMQPRPSPRYDHTATVHADRYLLIFGGCSHATCYGDLHVLDLQTMEWSQPETHGHFVTARAGHSGVTIDDNWFIVGGGDNKSGSQETLVLDMTKFVWSIVTTMEARDPLVSEGISLCSMLIDGERYLISFGGYNGKYNNEVFVLRPTRRNPSPPKIYQSPAAAAAAASVSAAYLIGSEERLDLNKPGDCDSDSKYSSKKTMTTGALEAMREEKRKLEISLQQAVDTNSSLRRKIDDINSNHADLTKELLSVQAQLVAERSRCFKLEAQIAELEGILKSLPSVEAEVTALRSEISAMEDSGKHSDGVERQNSTGVWSWLAGRD